MWDIYAFFAMFAALIVTVSVMHMFVLMRFVRLKMASMPDEYFAQLSATTDRQRCTQQFVTRYRLAHSVVALSGLLVFGWLLNYLQRPDWDKRWVLFPVMGYYVLQWLPMVFTAMIGLKHMKVFKRFLMQARRTATLKRRGLFDFVSPVVICFAALAFVLFVVLVFYASDDSMARLVLIGSATFDYAVTAISVYRLLYGPKRDPFETHSGRLYTMGLVVRTSIYSAIAVVFFMAFTVVALQMHLDRWMPFALAAFLTAATLLTFRVFIAPRFDFEATEESLST